MQNVQNPFDVFDAPQAAPTGVADMVALPRQPPAQTPAQAEKDTLEVTKLRRDLAKTPETDPALQQAVKGLGLDELLTSVGRARGHIDSGWATGIPGSIAGMIPGTPRKGFLGDLDAIQGSVIMEKLQALKDASKTGASGMGALSEKEGDRLAASVAALRPDMSADDLHKSLDIVERHANILQAIGAGENPDDPAVQKKYKIKPLPGADGKTAAPPADEPPPPVELPTPDLTPSGGTTRSVINPKLQKLAGRLGSLITQGASRNQIMGAAVAVDPSLRGDANFAASVDMALQERNSPSFKRYNKDKPYPFDPGFYTSEVPLTGGEQNLNRASQSAVGTGFAAGIDSAMGGTLDEAVGLMGGDEEAARQNKAQMAQSHPTANFLGQLGGGTAAAMTGEAALSRLGMAPGVARGMLADVGYGAGTGAGNADDGSRLEGAGIGAAAGLGGNIIGRGAANTLGRITAGVTSPEVRNVIAAKIPVTIGQALGKSKGIVGKTVKGIEDRLAGFPLVGDAINARRTEGIQRMNSAALDGALAPIKGNVGGALGEEGVAKAQDLVGNAFDAALKGKAATIDHNFITEAARAKRAISDLPRLGDIPGGGKGEVENSVDEIINSYFDDSGNISGENMQALLRDMGALKRGYKNDPLGSRVGKAIGAVEKSIENLFRRQAPDVMPQYDAAKAAFRRLSVIEDSVLRAKNNPEGGSALFTPGQLGMADRANTKKYSGTHAAAAGKGPFHDFQRDMQEVLPNKVPDSGSAGRLALAAVPAAISGSGAGIGYGVSGGDPASAGTGAGVGLGLAGLLALAYSRTGQRFLVGAATKRPAAARAAGKQIKRASKLIGHGAATQAALGAADD